MMLACAGGCPLRRADGRGTANSCADRPDRVRWSGDRRPQLCSYRGSTHQRALRRDLWPVFLLFPALSPPSAVLLCDGALVVVRLRLAVLLRSVFVSAVLGHLCLP